MNSCSRARLKKEIRSQKGIVLFAETNKFNFPVVPVMENSDWSISNGCYQICLTDFLTCTDVHDTFKPYHQTERVLSHPNGCKDVSINLGYDLGRGYRWSIIRAISQNVVKVNHNSVLSLIILLLKNLLVSMTEE